MRISIVMGMGLILCLFSSMTYGATAEPFGTPTWEPTGFVLFSAPIGTSDSGFAEFLESANKALPKPNYKINPDKFAVVPVPAHDGPYDNEFVEGVASAGFKSGTEFIESDLSGANGIWFGFMLIPSEGAPTGSSPDYASGPIIPNSLYGITFSGAFRREGAVFDDAFDGELFDVNTNLAGLVPDGTTFDGYSHDPAFFATGKVFGPPGASLPGSWTASFTLTDKLGSGYIVSESFTVAAAPVIPLPPAVLASLPLFGAMCCYARLRRKLNCRMIFVPIPGAGAGTGRTTCLPPVNKS